MFGSFDFQEFLSAFIVLFAVIDIIGSIPIISVSYTHLDVYKRQEWLMGQFLSR